MTSPKKADAAPTDVSAVGRRALARTGDGSWEGKERLAGPCWKENSSSDSEMSLHLPAKGWGEHHTRALWFSVFESGARSGAGCCSPAPPGRREVWEGRLAAQDAHILSHVFTRDDGE